MFQFYRYFWFCGLAASGKTTALKIVHDSLPEVQFFNDSFEVLEFINQDVQEQHHHKPTKKSFVLLDSTPVHYAVDQLIKKVAATDQKAIIELSRGFDQKGEVDFSYSYFFSQLPADIAKQSLFLYFHAPFAERKKRNQQRKSPKKKPTVFESFHCPEEAMDRFFMHDDFFQTMQSGEVDSLIIANNQSVEVLRQKVKTLFSGYNHESAAKI